MSDGGRFQDGDYTSKLYGIDGWTRRLVETGKFACRDAAIEGLVKDYEKRFLKNASPAQRFVLSTVATGLRVYMPESEVVRMVTQSMSPFLPRRWANKKAQRKVDRVLNGLGVCSNVHLFGLEETMRAWGKDAEPQSSPGDFFKDVLSSMLRSAVGMSSPTFGRRRRRSYNVGPVTVSAHVRHMKNGKTVHVKVHKRRRGAKRG